VLSLHLILFEWSAGGLAALVWVRRARVVGPGFTWLVASVFAATALAGWAAGGPGIGGALAMAAAGLAALARAGRVTPLIRGIEAVVAALAVTTVGVVGAQLPGSDWLGVARAFAGAALLGTVTVGMLLGHWYLVDPRLPRAPVKVLDVAVGVALVSDAVLLSLSPGVWSALSDPDAWQLLVWFWVALVVTTGVLVVAVWFAVREPAYPAMMAATGLLYLAVITAVGVDVIPRALAS
jgi:hypothetical protein